ncbi:EAL domain-containing protein [Marinomonas sp. 2405UD68-3]|uniref:sensor domain-containing protein n=1 Tax=Marinomonas sp. 2405UD68-3 TaxID=3391835 RepID=UPI0039C8E8AB
MKKDPVSISLDGNLRKVFDATPVPMAISKVNGNLEYVNAALLNMLGYTEQEIYQKNIVITHPDDMVINEKIRSSLQQDPFTPITVEKRYLHKTGRVIPGILTIVAQSDEMGEVQRFIAQIVDVTEKQKIEKARKLFRTLIDHSNDSFIIIDPVTSKIIDVNETACQNLGYSYEEMLTLSVMKIEAALPDDFSWKRHVDGLKESKGMILEGLHKRKDGSTYPAEVSVSYVKQDDSDYMLATVRNITERKVAENIIWQQANFDSLTGLANRSMLHNCLSKSLIKRSNPDHSTAVLYLDLDHFKDINDKFGHHSGDKILIEVASRIKGCVRDSDLVARMGGDEFTVIINDLKNTDGAIRIANDIIDSLSKPFTSGLIKSHISTSIGITFSPKDSDNADVLLKYADQAMYVAKSLGRKRYHLFDHSIQAELDARSWMNSALREAFDKQDFHLVYQPIVDLKTGECKRAEALIRWDHIEKGAIEPSEFIQIAEENGMIGDIGDWIFYEIAQQLKTWREAFGEKLQISVNTSPIQLDSFHLNLKNWCHYLDEINLLGSGIIIELTEGTIMHLNEGADEILSLFRSIGMQIAIDDFGTGYSSLAYLKKLDVDFVKIDQSFVQELTDSPDDIALCEAIVVLAHKLHLKVIAEGVETYEQAEKLADIGCDYAQGYYYSKGVVASDFECFLQSAFLNNTNQLCT